jgi:glutamate racemase
MIEDKKLNKLSIDERIHEALDKNADVIVLACTHYHWIEEEIKALAAGRAQVIQPERAIVAQLKRVLGRLS